MTTATTVTDDIKKLRKRLRKLATPFPEGPHGMQICGEADDVIEALTTTLAAERAKVEKMQIVIDAAQKFTDEVNTHSDYLKVRTWASARFDPYRLFRDALRTYRKERE